MFRRILIVVLGAWLAGCTQGSPTPSASSTAGPSGRRNLVCTTGMVGDLVSRVAGERATVTTMMGPGVDPHLYKATTSDVTRLRDADAVFYSGLHLEGKMTEVFESLETSGRAVFAVTVDIPEAKVSHVKGQPDPHVWMDPGLWALTVPVIVRSLSQLDPQGAEGYRRRGQEVSRSIQELDAWIRSETGALPRSRRILVTSHDAFAYFGRAYDFEVVALQGISTVSEAGTADVTRLVDFIKAHKVPAIFVESSVPRAAIERISQDSGVKVGGELFSDAMGAQGTPEGSYEGMIRHNVNLIVGALK